MFSEDVGTDPVCTEAFAVRTCNETFLITVPTAVLFTNEVLLFVNEHRNGWYGTASYFWARTIVELPLCLAVSVGYGLIAYHLSNQINDTSRAGKYVGVLCLASLTAQGIGLLIGTLAHSKANLANVMSVGVYLFNLLLCGFFAPLDNLPPAISWAQYLSFSKQTYELEMYVIYGSDRCPDGLVSKALIILDIQDYSATELNLYILIAHLVLVRITAFFFLVCKANHYKLEQLIYKLKVLMRCCASRCGGSSRLVEDTV
ncbi:ATP-binding cassette sub-family G member 4-like isoform X2 [Paramacrobiotus metropolitanus]|uniref:ATP-binding cassette sub-family G member 4-like isoform X2 n=1 Tax=Paramacrobiotus metropolitanus TaxID=2943436 RepID=UPI00244653B2|nr:ATP-binding cassette sub-family G member 4-like isoform X2 [Paramacrobiotus metropolitanus]